MNEWLRNQFMAPVYALVISFVTSLLLGAVLTDAPDVPGATGPGVKFVTQDGKEAPADKFRDVAVQIYRTSGKSHKVGDDGSFLFSEDTEWPVTVCAALPAGWKAQAPSFESVSRVTCWELDKPAGVVALTVVNSGG